MLSEATPDVQLAAPFDLTSTTLENSLFRNVLYTTAQLQIVAMNVKDRIKTETHRYTTQMITVVAGSARVFIDDQAFTIKAGQSIIVPAGATHTVLSVGPEPLRLWTVYAPPEHEPGVKQSVAPL
jgi:mannose-6-phosphate isomerase-like protein (cupin superfamily)